jgi:hypothetical protein
MAGNEGGRLHKLVIVVLARGVVRYGMEFMLTGTKICARLVLFMRISPDYAVRSSAWACNCAKRCMTGSFTVTGTVQSSVQESAAA